MIDRAEIAIEIAAGVAAAVADVAVARTLKSSVRVRVLTSWTCRQSVDRETED
jgi:hypothetical protein